MPSEEPPLTGGELNAASTSAVVGIHTAHLVTSIAVSRP